MGTFRNIIFSIWHHLCLLLPIDRKKVVFQSFNGMPFGCNPKAIALALHKLDPTIKIIWFSNRGNSKSTPDWIKEIKTLKWKVLQECTAKVWVANHRKDKKISKKRKGQFYIQTWHGMLKGKRVEKDVEEHLGEAYIENAKYDSSIADLFVSNCKFITDLYHRAFWYDGEVLECGTPRCDALINNPNGTGVVRKHFGVSSDTKLILYAPTFRKNYEDVYDLDFDMVLLAFKQRFGGKFKLLVRMHPNLINCHFHFQYNEDILEASSYPDLYELLAECDYQINDYSGSMFEFGFIRKPVFLYANDIDTFAGDRGFYFPMEILPFPLATTNEELKENILNFNDDKYQKALDAFYADKGVKETGHASEDVAKIILDVIYNRRK